MSTSNYNYNNANNTQNTKLVKNEQKFAENIKSLTKELRSEQ